MNAISSPSPPLFKLAWSLKLDAAPVGLALAREKNWFLAWDQAGMVYLFNRQGQQQATLFPKAVVQACCADDGSAYVVVGNQGELCWLNPDLRPRWERQFAHPLVAAALDPFGQYVAVADQQGQLYLCNRQGKPLHQVHCPRALYHLAFIPELPLLVGCADLGLIVCCTWEGQMLWRDGLVAHTGSLAVDSDGSHILVACFSEGIKVYQRAGQAQASWKVADGCRLAAMALDGSRTLASGLGSQLFLLDKQGQTVAWQKLDYPIAALALAALGEWAVVAQVGGPLLAWDLGKL